MAKEQKLSYEELLDIYNQAPCGFHSLDKDGMIIHINNTELNWLGRTRDEVVGKMRFIDLVDAKSVENFRQTFPVFLKQGWIKNVRFNIVGKGDKTTPVLVSATAVRDSKGRYLYSRSVLTDISDQEKIKEALGVIGSAELIDGRKLSKEMKVLVLRNIIKDLGAEE